MGGCTPTTDKTAAAFNPKAFKLKQTNTLASLKGLSPAANSGLFGLTCVALDEGGCILAICVEKSKWLYTRKSGSSQKSKLILEQCQSDTQLTKQQLEVNYKGANAPKFRSTDLTEESFNELKSLSEPKYKMKVMSYVCPISMQVMRQPCQMLCCKGLDRWGERPYLLDEVYEHQRCALCQQVAYQDYIEFRQSKQDQINAFRHKILNTYRALSHEQKRNWKILIDNEFGQDYAKQPFEAKKK